MRVKSKVLVVAILSFVLAVICIVMAGYYMGGAVSETLPIKKAPVLYACHAHENPSYIDCCYMWERSRELEPSCVWKGNGTYKVQRSRA